MEKTATIPAPFVMRRVDDGIEMRCDACRWCTAQGDSLACRRYPPTVTTLLVPVGINPVTKQPDLRFHNQAAYPPITAAEWCGEFQSRDGFRDER